MAPGILQFKNGFMSLDVLSQQVVQLTRRCEVATG